ncbi:MAG: hypothetical protein FWE53_05190, partial [Firmicutes bacterium]|nr:hypothetical protein [Bacillota bacterium]
MAENKATVDVVNSEDVTTQVADTNKILAAEQEAKKKAAEGKKDFNIKDFSIDKVNEDWLRYEFPKLKAEDQVKLLDNTEFKLAAVTREGGFNALLKQLPEQQLESFFNDPAVVNELNRADVFSKVLKTIPTDNLALLRQVGANIHPSNYNNLDFQKNVFRHMSYTAQTRAVQHMFENYHHLENRKALNQFLNDMGGTANLNSFLGGGNKNAKIIAILEQEAISPGLSPENQQRLINELNEPVLKPMQFNMMFTMMQKSGTIPSANLGASFMQQFVASFGMGAGSGFTEYFKSSFANTGYTGSKEQMANMGQILNARYAYLDSEFKRNGGKANIHMIAERLGAQSPEAAKIGTEAMSFNADHSYYATNKGKHDIVHANMFNMVSQYSKELDTLDANDPRRATIEKLLGKYYEYGKGRGLDFRAMSAKSENGVRDFDAATKGADMNLIQGRFVGGHSEELTQNIGSIVSRAESDLDFAATINPNVLTKLKMLNKLENAPDGNKQEAMNETYKLFIKTDTNLASDIAKIAETMGGEYGELADKAGGWAAKKLQDDFHQKFVPSQASAAEELSAENASNEKALDSPVAAAQGNKDKVLSPEEVMAKANAKDKNLPEDALEAETNNSY